MTEQALTHPATTHSALADPALRRFAAGVRTAYGPRLERLVLFGSRARGDHRDDSDYDLAVFLRGFTTFWKELQPLGGLATDVLLETGAFISAKPFPAGAYREDRPLMRAIASDGLDL